MKTLIISTCKEKLHDLEFTKPIENILRGGGAEFKKVNYLQEFSTEEFTHIIITGTSLQDNDYLNHLNKFEFIKNTKHKILGICAGMQIIQKIFNQNSELKSKTEIGFYEKKLSKIHNFKNSASNKTQKTPDLRNSLSPRS